MSVVEKSTFRRNFQRWVQMNYGENSRTKTITRTKYNKICRYLLGEPLIETDAKFRFWVKSKGFRIVQSEDMSLYGTLYVPVKVPHTRSMDAMYPYEESMGPRTQVLEYRRVAVADDFFDIISSVHINDRGIHVGQKKTYRAVANTYAFLPREAVSYYLMSCSTCKLRIQRCNSILLKHGRPVTPTSDLESSDAEASISSHDSDDESYSVRKLKKEPQEGLFEENGARNGMISSQRDTAETSLNGSQGHSLKEGSEDGALGRGLPPGYQTYSSDHKQEVINYAKETTVREAARKYCVPRSTVQVWCKHGTGVKKEKRSPLSGGRRLSYSSETDDKLLQWVIKEQENGTPVTKDAIQLQARSLVRDECPDFKASSGWVEKFMSRHNLAVATTMSSTNTNEAIPISYVVASPASAPSPVGGNHSSYSPRGDGRSFTSEDTRSDSGRSEEEDDMDDGSASLENMAAPISQSVIREPPNLNEILKTSGLSGSASSGLKDDDDDDGEGDDADGDAERGESGAVNPERLKAFNMFVRLFVDENLDRLVPISKQPKEKILAIIQSCQRQFPEFRDRARKRIRTYLKSCRRLKKLKEPLKRTADQMNILASACASEVENSKRPRLETDSPATPPVTTTNMTATCMSVTSPAIKSRSSTQCQLSPSEIQAIRHLIQGYRESAAFLYRSADELEQLLPPP
ncbi:nucleolar protein 4-like isoform X3 [Actinia tenebrosa]|uniref:Nucleolar protein 4-like isoform X3 n=1 Tax=Actinia tenebrosa TaxID=6105 RepID=A0A6P8HGE0_ACTTE|nr:nucleolar protein 4-like isoform X3 [Actinia tenebrosa]